MGLNAFGVNVDTSFYKWFTGEFAKSFAERFPDAEGMTLVILDPAKRIDAFDDWKHPLDYAMVCYFLGNEAAHDDEGGTRENVARKLRFVLRTGGKPSLEAEAGRAFTHLVLPGDFPWQGAGMYRGYIGGVSGLKKQEDWTVYKQCVNKLIELQTAVKRAAITRADALRNDPSQLEAIRYEAKYLINIDVSDLFPEYAATA